ncbi:hypothetical protein PENSPDRAFT_740463 [Peniophora sp. CONT]|nr:hypothetical protein PENSPDRAFT_740463 [Peniophora sp. CONT]
MLSIHSLPAELLSYVFEEYVERPSAGSPAQLRLVCKCWRDISEETPSIWSRMVMGHGTKWTQRALEWSGSYPIDINWVVGNSRADWHDCMLLVLQNLCRIGNLRLGFPPNHFSGRISQIMVVLGDHPAPLLEVFYLNGPVNPRARPEIGATFMSIPPPHLKELNLSNCNIALHCPILRAPELLHLRLDGCTLWTTVDEVLETLKMLPRLQTFKWRESVPKVDDFTESTLLSSCKVAVGMIPMSNMSTFSVCHKVEVIVHLMTCVELPSSCDLHLNADLSSNPTTAGLVEAMDRVLSPYLSTRFPIGSGTGFPVFTVAHSYTSRLRRGTTAKWSMNADAAIHEIEYGDGDFSITLGGGDLQDEELLIMIWWMIERWPATRLAVRHFLATHNALFGTNPNDFARYLPSWARLLVKFEAVEELSVSGQSTTFLPALLSSPHVRLFPRLQIIVVHHAQYESPEVGLLVAALLQRHDATSTSSPYKVVLERCEVDHILRPKREMIVALGALR